MNKRNVSAIRSNNLKSSDVSLHLGRELAILRRRQSITQVALASAAAIAESSVQRLESLGEGRMATLESICRALRIEIDGLPSPGAPMALRLRRARGERKVRDVAAIAHVDPRTVEALEEGMGSIRSMHALLGALRRRIVLSPATSLRVSRPVYGRDERFTPLEFTSRLLPILGSLSLDPCGHPDSPTSQLADRMITEREDGLQRDWCARNGTFVFVNPPFSRTRPFGLKALEEFGAGRAAAIVLLVRAAWDTLLFQERLVFEADTYALQERPKFLSPSGLHIGENPRAPMALSLHVLGASRFQAFQIAKAYKCAHFEPKSLGN